MLTFRGLGVNVKETQDNDGNVFQYETPKRASHTFFPQRTGDQKIGSEIQSFSEILITVHLIAFLTVRLRKLILM